MQTGFSVSHPRPPPPSPTQVPRVFPPRSILSSEQSIPLSFPEGPSDRGVPAQVGGSLRGRGGPGRAAIGAIMIAVRRLAPSPRLFGGCTGRLFCSERTSKQGRWAPASGPTHASHPARPARPLRVASPSLRRHRRCARDSSVARDLSVARDSSVARD